MRNSAILTALAGLSAALVATGCAAGNQYGPQLASSGCDGLANVDRDLANLYAPGNITHVEPLQRRHPHPDRDVPGESLGANLYVRAQPGIHAAYAERVLTCHAAGHAGADVGANDPLRVAGVADVDVTQVGSGLRISVKGVDRQAADAILARARAMRHPAGQVHVRQVAEASPVQASAL